MNAKVCVCVCVCPYNVHCNVHILSVFQTVTRHVWQAV
jgi:hypothetical protein